MIHLKKNPNFPHRFFWFLSLILTGLLNACNSNNLPLVSVGLNSRYNDQQPALSGDGRWLTFVSNRNGNSQIVLYDLKSKNFVDLPNLSNSAAIAESPSLTKTGRYLAYLTTVDGRPGIAVYDRAIQRSVIVSQGYRSWLRNPHISPDGRYIVFETSRRGQWDLEILDLGPNIELDIPNGAPINSNN